MSANIIADNNTLEVLNNYDYEPEGSIHFTSIILITYNKPAYTKLCIESIKKFTPKDSYEIIVVDNNSTDGTKGNIKVKLFRVRKKLLENISVELKKQEECYG